MTEEQIIEHLADAVEAYRWDPLFEHSAHAKHNYYGACAVCQEDVIRIVRVTLAALADIKSKAESS